MQADGMFTKIMTDETLEETVRHGTVAFPFQFYDEDIWDFDLHCMDWHWHPELELVYVESGEAICRIQEDTLRLPAGQAVLINSQALHRFESESSTRIPNAVFSPQIFSAESSLLYQKYVAPFLSCGSPFQIFSPAVPWQDECLRHIRALFRIQRETGDELRTVLELLSLWHTFYPHLPAGASAAGPQGRNQLRLFQMMQLIQEHYTRDLTLEEISAAASIKKSLAMQIFKKGIGMSPVAYLIHYRLTQAAAMLAESRASVKAISQQTGFQSPGYFCRRFREQYGMSPLAYREGHKTVLGYNSPGDRDI